MPIGEGKTVCIVGAGLAGSLLACYLAKLGFKVNLYERRPDPRAVGFIGGRSINLALSARGLWGLAGIGLDQEILKHAIPMKGRMIHPATLPPEGGDLNFQPYSHDPQDAINSISRGGLNLALIHAAAGYDNVSFFFDHRCLDIDPERCTASFQHETTGIMGQGPMVVAEADLVIGADGAFSPVRTRLQKNDRFEYSQTYLSHGYKELHIPALGATGGLPASEAGATGGLPASGEYTGAAPRADKPPVPPANGPGKWNGYALDPNALHIWPRGRAMMIALPNPDKSFTCTLFWPFEGDHSFANLRTESDVWSFFKQHYPDAVPLMPTLADDFLKNPTSSLVTVRCWPWVYRCTPGMSDASSESRGLSGKAIALAGDAAHAIVPFFGQGINAGFEDVRILCECLERHACRGGAWMHDALDEYQNLRKPHTDAIARMALDNFVEMRDKVGSKLFLYRKKLEHLLHDLAPATLVPKYNLVSFTTVPYAEALKRSTRIDRVLRLLVLLAALLLVGILVLFRFPVGLLLVLVLVSGWFVWDLRQTREDTST
jgi:kynurenine 3-monooxygenase